jgi:TolB-like protein
VTDIFLSYNREDLAVARHFAKAFEGQGFKVWWDTTLRAGEAYDEVTEAALRSAKAVVVLWSQKSVASRWVRAEALLAYRNNTFVPCMIEPCERPIMFELTQTAELLGWKGNTNDPRWKAFLQDVQMRVMDANISNNDQPQLAALVSKPPTLNPNRRVLLLAGGVAGGASLALLAYFNADAIGGLFGPPKRQNAIAVLPFANISGDSSQSYFSDGLSAEVRAALASNPQLMVAAQTSSDVFKDARETPQNMSRKLGVAFLLDGNVRKSAGNARIVTELIDGKTGLTSWSQTFDRPLTDIFAVQSEIAQAVVSALLSTLPQAKAGKSKKTPAAVPAKGGTNNVAAFENFLRGRALFEAGLSVQTDLQALAAFDAALSLDPNYAAAHARRARTLAVLANQSGDASLIRSRLQSALVAARKSVELAPEFADGYSALGYVLFTTGLNARDAKPAFDKSLQYGSGDGDVLTGFAMFCGRTRRQREAETSILSAIEHDPLNPTVFRCAGQIKAMAGDDAGAISYYQRALAMNPLASITYSLLGISLLFQNQFAEARAAFDKEKNRMFALTGLAILNHKQGQKTDAEAALGKLIEEFGDSALFQQAQVYAVWGQSEKALSTLERGYVVGDSGLASLYTDRFFDGINQEPRFSQLLRSIGFE